MTTFLYALLGGSLIGLSASLLLLTHGRVAGISGIVGRVFDRDDASSPRWRPAFVGGLLFGGLVIAGVAPASLVTPTQVGSGAVVVAGILVGAGTALGSGCTSGHGVCGTSRFSLRSLVATAVFLFVGVVTASTFSLAMGGSSWAP